MKKFLMLTALGTALLFLTGCWSRPGSVSPSTIAFNSGQTYTVVKRNVKGVDVAAMLLTFPITFPDSEAALRNALEKYDADGLINVTIDTSYLSFIFFTLEWTTIHGDAIKLRTIK